MCILLVKKLDSMLFCVRVNTVSGDNYEKCGKILRAKRYSRPRGFNIAGASAPVAPAVPTPLVYTYAGFTASSPRAHRSLSTTIQ